MDPLRFAMTDTPSLLSPHAPPDLVKAEACLRSGDLAGFQALMAREAAKLTDLYGVTALHLAVAHRSTLGVRHALQHKGDQQATDRHGEIPLMWACRNPSSVALDLMTLFATYATGPTAALHLASLVNHRGQTALHLAASHHGLDACQKLLDQFFADPNVQDQDGNTALHLLAIRGLTGLNGLREHGLNAALRNREGRTALDMARSYGHTATVLELETPVDLDSAVVTALLPASIPMSVRQRRLQNALRLGADANATIDGEKPLTRAVMNDWGPLVWVLLVDGQANPNGCVNPDQRDHPLCRAVSNRKVQPMILNVLVGAGSDVNVQAPGQGGKTPLHLAASDHAFEKVEALLELGANPLARDQHGLTPLDLATRAPLPASVASPGQKAPDVVRQELLDLLTLAQVTWERNVLATAATPFPADSGTTRPRPRL